MDGSSSDLKIDPQILTPLVREITRYDKAEVTGWSADRLSGAGEAAQGIYRLQGDARSGLEDLTWSVILKILSTGSEEIEQSTRSPGGWNYWLREALAYQSDIPAYLPPGLGMACSYGFQQQPDETCWLWLEDIRSDGNPGSIEHSAQIARLLGRMNGQFVLESSTAKPLPDFPWLSRRWLQDSVTDSAAAVDLLLKVGANPNVRLLYTPRFQEYILNLWPKRNFYFQIYNTLPQTFCHRDVFCRNILLQSMPDNEVRYDLIDWNFCGTGSLGEELTSLVWANLLFGDTPYESAQELQSQVFEHYLQGLADAGWQGDPRIVRLGFTIGSSFRYTLATLRPILSILLTDGFTAEWPTVITSFTFAEAGKLWSQLTEEFILPLEQEAHRLVYELGLG